MNIGFTSKTYKHDKAPNVETIVYKWRSREALVMYMSLVYGEEFAKKLLNEVDETLAFFSECSATFWDGKFKGVSTSNYVTGHTEPWRRRFIHEFSKDIVDNERIKDIRAKG